MSKLGPLVDALKKEHPDAGYDAHSLASTVASILQFQEDVLGINVSCAAAITDATLLTTTLLAAAASWLVA